MEETWSSCRPPSSHLRSVGTRRSNPLSSRLPPLAECELLLVAAVVAPRPKTLWAVFPEKGLGFPRSSQPFDAIKPAKIFSLTENRFYHIPLRQDLQPHGHGRCIGSGHGWLAIAIAEVAADPDYENGTKVYLLNPVTGRKIRLPLLPTCRRFSVFGPDCRGLKAVVCSPAGSKGHTIFLLKRLSLIREHRTYRQLAYTSPLVRRWVIVDHSPFGLVDVECHCSQIYTLYVGGNIHIWDFNMGVLRRLNVVPPLGHPEVDWEIGNLVSTPWGILLNVVGLSPYAAVRVLKVDFYASIFVDVECLEDHALFLGFHTSLCLSPLDFPQVKKNYIYFMGNHSCVFGSYRGYGRPACMGIYSFKDGSSGPLDPELSTWPPPIWFIPSLTFEMYLPSAKAWRSLCTAPLS